MLSCSLCSWRSLFLFETKLLLTLVVTSVEGLKRLSSVLQDLFYHQNTSIFKMYLVEFSLASYKNMKIKSTFLFVWGFGGFFVRFFQNYWGSSNSKFCSPVRCPEKAFVGHTLSFDCKLQNTWELGFFCRRKLWHFQCWSQRWSE